MEYLLTNEVVMDPRNEPRGAEGKANYLSLNLLAGADGLRSITSGQNVVN